MRIFTGGVAHAARVIEEDLQDRDTRLNKPHVTALADLTACALSCHNVNTAEWQSVLPRKVEDVKSKERYISRVLANSLIDHIDVMEVYP